MAITQNITWKDTVYAQNLEDAAVETGWTPEIPNPAFVEGGTEPATIPNISKELNFKRWIKAKAQNMRTEQANRRALTSVVAEEDN